MSLLQLIIIVMGFIFLLFSIDLYERKRFNILHFLVFFGGTGVVVLASLREDFLTAFGLFFGVARGADVIVYMSILFLGYLYFELLNKFTKQDILSSKLIAYIALEKVGQQIFGDRKKIQSIGKSKYCFLIRAYNEGTIIASVIDEIVTSGFENIVVCDDGSTDDTVLIVRHLQKKYPGLLLLEHPINRGPGAANKTLFSWANKYGEYFGIEWWVTYDADGQMNIKDMKNFMKYTDTGAYEVILGSRFIKGGKADNISWVRRIILWGSKFVTLVFNKIYVTDPTNGYKVIHKNALEKITIESDGFMYASEFLEQIQINKLKRIEVPVKIRYTDYSVNKGQKSSNAWKILQKLIYKALFYK